MSKFDRVKQWAAFSRNWHIYDAKWQNPFTSAKTITKVLMIFFSFDNKICDCRCCKDEIKQCIIPWLTVETMWWWSTVNTSHCWGESGNTEYTIIIQVIIILHCILIQEGSICIVWLKGYPAAFKHMGRTNGKLWIPAWQLHERDPTLILWKAVYNNMENNLMRRNNIARLHIFPEEEVGNVIDTAKH